TGQVAGRQFENSDSGYTTMVYVSRATHGAGIAIGLLFLLALVLIWYKPVSDAMKNASTTMMLLLVLAVTLLGTADSRAFFEKTDRTEIIPILPNQSAFSIPGFGANKDSQVQFDSEAYLNANKVPQKFFQIPHAKLTGSAGYSFLAGWDY